MNRASSYDRPSGPAPPNIVPATLHFQHDHLWVGQNADPFVFFAIKAVSAQQNNVAQAISNNHASAISERITNMEDIHSTNEKFNDVKNRRTNALPRESPAKALNFPLMHLVATTLSYDDKALTKDLSRGMPLAGHAPRANCLTTIHQRAKTATSTWALGVGKRNLLVKGRLLKSYDNKLFKARWAKTSEEVGKGWVIKLLPVTPEVLKSIPLTPRWCILENHGSGVKRRISDDVKMSGINDNLELEDTSVPHSLNAEYATARTCGRRYSQFPYYY